ncbi:MAG: SCP2 sterol-binding domain-containing protein [Candidatus Promineifilaceae bacterium]|nr:SCP2 sterol-binding domain-containing protein [Candidatus Promineifilaceae bacterium]
MENAAYALFTRLQQEKQQAVDKVLRSGLLVLLHVTQPETFIWLDARRPPLEIGFGPARLRPDLEVIVDADTLHRVLLGQISLRQAHSSGRVQVRGPIWRVSALGDFFSQAPALYPDVLREQGLAAG